MTQLLTIEEVAGILRCSRMTVYRLVRRRKIRALRVGRNYRIDMSDLSDFLAGGAV